MIEEEVSGKPSGFMLGREFIIVLVIVFSGLSFTLGYFVGKNSTPVPEQSIKAVEALPQQKPDISPVPSTAPAQPSGQQSNLPGQQSDTAPVREIPVSAVSLPERPAAKESGNSKAAVREAALSPASGDRKKGEDTPKTESRNVEKPGSVNAAQEQTVLYSVQIGAFRNIADAKSLKSKFDKKGYKSFVYASKNKKGQKIFKVKTGEFKEKKEAEVLALKIKNSEGLQTYVTTKND